MHIINIAIFVIVHLVCGIIFYKFGLPESQALTYLTFSQAQNWGLRNTIMFQLYKKLKLFWYLFIKYLIRNLMFSASNIPDLVVATNGENESPKLVFVPKGGFEYKSVFSWSNLMD